MRSKIYEVTTHDSTPFLVRATSIRKAIAFISDKTITARVPSQDRLIELGQEGHRVLDATAEPDANAIDARFDQFGENVKVTEKDGVTTIETGEIF